MRRYESPSQTWSRLDSLRSARLRLCEEMAALTIPKLCLPAGTDVLTMEQTNDYQSVGAMVVNHVVNKLVIALFTPPFYVLDLDPATKKRILALGLTEQDLAAALAEGERDGAAALEASGQRQKLYLMMRHLVVCGQATLDRFSSKDELRIIGIRNFVVARTGNGKLKTLVIREKLLFDELEPNVQALLQRRFQSDAAVTHYRRIQRLPNGDYRMDQAVDEIVLPQDRFGAKWSEDRLPFSVPVWDLDDESDYATSLVEEHLNDLRALSALSESTVDGAVLGAEVRSLVNPTGNTTADDLNKSKNGDYVPGQEGDITTVTADNAQGVKMAFDVLSRYEQRIGRAFLMQSAVTRNAERVTAEEVRLNSQELETAYGGRYSALGATVQPEVARWSLDRAGFTIKGTKVRVIVLTGDKALGRLAKVDRLKAALQDLGQTGLLPEQLQMRLKYNALSKDIGAGHGVKLEDYVMTDEEFAQAQQAQQVSRVEEQAAIAGAQAGAQGAIQQ